ncbi:uncharacterized protein [Primulina huaijiensis]|uniref:uncharacterized protein n=1 Tax=Primulina huaijiensis TaxID=1492673 RepID=UPI003CC6F74C
MPAVWFALKRSLQCKSEPGSVHDKTLPNISTKKKGGGRSGCSKSIANLKDVVIHGSKRHTEKPPICSPRSIGSSELMYPITHEVILDNSTCELKLRNFPNSGGRCGGDGDVSDYVGMLKPGTHGPGRLQVGRVKNSGILGSPIRRTASSVSLRSSGFGVIPTRHRSSFGADFHGGLFCHKCGEQFGKWEAVEEHNLSEHAVTELIEGDSSRRIVEIICRASCSNTEYNKNNRVAIERILKVHNMQKLAQFEEYRELVIIKANKLAKKHPRCLADGNELLRFHGTTVECSLGLKGSSSLCTSNNCHVCWILRNGFSTKEELSNGIGVFTASTSSRALESIQESDENGSTRKALIVCRVIAGRVHRPLENFQVLVGQSGFDSLAGRIGLHSNIEELYLLSPRALLPCFVVIYKP